MKGGWIRVFLYHGLTKLTEAASGRTGSWLLYTSTLKPHGRQRNEQERRERDLDRAFDGRATEAALP